MSTRYYITIYLNHLGILFKIAKGIARALIRKFDVKKRAYYGNTSMDSEISLLMANQSLVRKFVIL